MSKIILASKSPRRTELLSIHNIDFEVVVSSIDEKAIEERFIGSPAMLVKALSCAKAENVKERLNTDKLIIAADTVVEIDSKVLGKPRDFDDAVATLKMLSGKEHFVHTGVTVIKGDKKESFTESASVHFRELTENEIINYVKSGQPMDKAGSYGIQGIASKFIDKICGDYFTIVGLPLTRLCVVLRDVFDLDFDDLVADGK